MRKRILGAAVLFSFIVSLTAASNMKEDVKIKEVPAMEGLAAGSIRFGSCNFRKFIYHRIR